MKHASFSPSIDEENDSVVSKEENIPVVASRNKKKIKGTSHGNLRVSTKINNASTSSIVCSNSKGSLTTKKRVLQLKIF